MVTAIIRWISSPPGKFIEFFGKAKDWAVTKMGELVSWLAGLPGRILSAIGNLGSLLSNAGRDLLTGLWNGLQSMAGWLSSQLTSFFSRLVPQWVKDALGIGSPSRLMADEVGREIPAGVALGVTENSHVVRSATQSMVDQALDGGAAGHLGGALSGAGSSGQGGRTTIIERMEVHLQGWIDLRDPSAAARRFMLDFREELRRLEADYA
ncbi:hypothetical protein [Herbidospora sp. NBRC 101105]|uniref:phage tail protein n=1 Tax=Herbidospora sp. NBRC 101105 TaxID=3032195 RepID=UPI0024A17E30|nr:hypothetical protein [Herbidospora sp. NBRC 101105]GLX92930.1 hypothetical protein Hesp01_08800 [Herbidospora sp. NBRC 101105]